MIVMKAAYCNLCLELVIDIWKYKQRIQDLIAFCVIAWCELHDFENMLF